MSRKTNRVKLSYVPLEEALEWKFDGNPKDHDIPAIKRSIERFGFQGAINYDETTEQISAGHGRLTALYELQAEGKGRPKNIPQDRGKRWLVPVLRGSGFDDDDEYTAYVVADNWITQLGGWKDDLLRSIFSDFRGRNVSFEGIGFTKKQVDRVLRDLDPSKKQTGKRPDDKLDAFLDATIKMVKIYLPEDEYDGFLDMLSELGEAWETPDNNSAVVVRAVRDSYSELSVEDADPA